MMKKKILVIVPAYNEESSIKGVIESIKCKAPFADILVINDGSTDRTDVIARNMDIKVVDLPFNMGIGAAMQSGYKYAWSRGYDFAVQVDADGQHPPAQIEPLLTPVVSGKADISIGSRFYSKRYNHTWARLAGMIFFSRIISIILREKVTDTTSGFRAVNKKVIHFFSNNYPDDFPEVEAIVLAHKAGFCITEVAVNIEERKGGISSITNIDGIYYMAKVLLAVLVDLIKKVKR